VLDCVHCIIISALVTLSRDKFLTSVFLLFYCSFPVLLLVCLLVLETIAFPCISTGNYQFPIVSATKIALSTVRSWLEGNADCVDRIVFCVFTVRDETVYETFLPAYFPV